MGKKRRIMTSAKFDVKHSTHPANGRTEADEAPEVVTAPQTEKVVEVSTPPITVTPVVTEKVTMKEVKVEKKKVGKHIFIKMEPLISPVLDERSIKGKITLRLKLHLIAPKVEEKVRHRIPQLNDAYLNYMYRYGSSAASSGVMQLESVMRKLQRLTDKILGKDIVKVLIEEVSRTRSG